MNISSHEDILEPARLQQQVKSDQMKNLFLESNLSLGLLAKDTIFYGIVTGLSRATTIILVPIFTRTLSVVEFGIVDTLLLISNAALLLGNAGIDSALMFYYYHVSEAEKGTYVATGMWIRLLMGLIVTAIAIVLAPVLSAFVFGTEKYSLWTSLTFLLVPVTLVMTYCFDLLRIERQRSWFLTLSALRVVVLLSGTLWVLYSYAEEKLEAFLLFRIVPDALMAVILVVLLSKRYRLADFSLTAAKEILIYGVPFVPAVAMYWGLSFVDRWFLFQNVSADEVGVYALAVKLGLILTLFSTAIQMAFNPFSMAVKDHEKSNEFYSRAFGFTMMSGCILLLFIGANLQFLISMFGGRQYFDAEEPALVLLLSNVCYTGYVFFATGTNIQKKTVLNVFSFGASLLTAIVLTALLVPLWGSMGAALAIMIANGTLACLALYFSQNVHPVPYNVKRVGAGVLMCTGIVFLMGMLSPTGNLGRIVLNNLIALGSTFVLVKVMLSRDQSQKLWHRLGLARLT